MKLGKTRFATAFLTLHSMHMQKANLDAYSFQKKWNTSNLQKEVGGRSCTYESLIPLGTILFMLLKSVVP